MTKYMVVICYLYKYLPQNITHKKSLQKPIAKLLYLEAYCIFKLQGFISLVFYTKFLLTEFCKHSDDEKSVL